jgi:hypothetical protein
VLPGKIFSSEYAVPFRDVGGYQKKLDVGGYHFFQRIVRSKLQWDLIGQKVKNSEKKIKK